MLAALRGYGVAPLTSMMYSFCNGLAGPPPLLVACFTNPRVNAMPMVEAGS